MANQRTSGGNRPAGEARGTRGAKPARTGSGRPGGKGKGRAAKNVVAPQRPWGLIVAAAVVVVFAAGAIGYAVVTVNRKNADKASAPEDIAGVRSFDYKAGQAHVETPVSYKESPPVGGAHDPRWADCTGTVYTVDIRHENAVHSLEHGAVWITYNPDTVSPGDVSTLASLVDGRPNRLLSPYAGQDSPISVQSWAHQLKVDKASDPRIRQFADLMAGNPKYYPEIGASCENPAFKANPLKAGETSAPVGASDMPTPSPAPPSSAP